jgi:hypothetical protein
MNAAENRHALQEFDPTFLHGALQKIRGVPTCGVDRSRARRWAAGTELVKKAESGLDWLLRLFLAGERMAPLRSDDGGGAVAHEQHEPTRLQRLAKDQVIAKEFSRPSSRSQHIEKRTLIVG